MLKEIITKMAWKLSANYKYGYSIDCLSDDIAKDIAWDDPTEIKNAIIEYLKETSDKVYTEGETEISYYGYHAGLNCYWADTNAYTEWYCDKPDWWDNMADGDY